MPSPYPTNPPKAILNSQKHIKYWLRCLKTYLPDVYIGTDSQRLSLAFFILSALDLLSALHTHITPSERAAHIDWIYTLQHPDGGFRGFTGAVEGGVWDPANLAATYFALESLMVLRDGLGRVKGRECLGWIRRLQREDGSFGEMIGKGGRVEGGGDPRYCYLAAGVRWALRRGELNEMEDVDVEALVEYVERCITYEGGIAQAPLHEAHAGETYCGIGVLKLLGRLPDQKGVLSHRSTVSSEFMEKMLRWLLSRQTLMLYENEESMQTLMPQEDEDYTIGKKESPNLTPKLFPPTFHVQGAFPMSIGEVSNPTPDFAKVPQERLHWAGFNGRCNKVADTCYAFWVGGSLGMLNKVHLQDFNAIRAYLLDKTQHFIGGFGKLPGDPPDILHSYLGLAALAIMHEPELKSIDSTLCISKSAIEEYEQYIAGQM